MVTLPIAPFLVGSDLTPVQEKLPAFADGLISWEARAKHTGIQRPSMVRIEARDYEAALDEMQRQFLTNTWGDGLPLNAPTEARLAWMLRGTDRQRHQVLGKIMPQGGIATVETLAIAFAMAGGRPEYLPVLIAAIEAIVDPSLEHDKWQATSGSTFPVVLVNGPMAQQIRLNSGFGLLGPDPRHAAGASLGRALRLLLQNVGGALPGTGTMAMFGAMRYTNAVFAEDEEGLPEGWQPVCTDHFGWPRGTNAVTVYVATGATNIMRRGVGKETPEEEGLQSLHRVARYLRSPSPHYTHGWAHGTPGALLMSRVVARQLAGPAGPRLASSASSGSTPAYPRPTCVRPVWCSGLSRRQSRKPWPLPSGNHGQLPARPNSSFLALPAAIIRPTTSGCRRTRPKSPAARLPCQPTGTPCSPRQMLHRVPA